MDKIKVLVVDDSRVARKFICDTISSDSSMEVIGEAVDGQDAIEKIELLQPDLVTLDVIMPKLTGIGVIDRVMEKNPVRILLVSSVTEKNAEITIKALQKGALDFITKPSSEDFSQISQELLIKLRTLARIPLSLISKPDKSASPKKEIHKEYVKSFTEAIGIGVSTGGPSTLMSMLCEIPKNFPLPIFIVQHMPKFFTGELAANLDHKCQIRVKEAENNEKVEPGTAYLAPGGLHLKVANNRIQLSDEPPINSQKPAVDMLLISLAEAYRNKSCAIILTGMGTDGLQGCDAVKARGGLVAAQNEASSVVFSMPKAIIEAGLADRVLDIQEFPEFLISLTEIKYS
jgi:two-component system, chemotaxis family, protein-glutamate methylesterase/glutaminase